MRPTPRALGTITEIEIEVGGDPTLILIEAGIYASGTDFRIHRVWFEDSGEPIPDEVWDEHGDRIREEALDALRRERF